MEEWGRSMEIKYKKLIFNPNAYFDIKRKEVILPISPEWDNLVKWKKEFPNVHKRILYVADELQKSQKRDEEWRKPTIEIRGGLSLHTWKYETGEIRTTQEFRGELPHGERINYHQNGNKISEEFFRMGEKHGEQKFYHTDGWYFGNQQFKNGMKSGTWETFYSDKSPHTLTKYENGKKIFECVYRKYSAYRENRIPQVIKEISYVDGKMHGMFLDCFVNGKRRTQGIMKDGEMDGNWDFFMNDGKTLELSVLMDGGKIKDVKYKRHVSD